ncbi:hypothetical protein Tco_0635160 [Tanacetum coccineum]
MIKEIVDAAIDDERARHANVGNDARGSRPVRGQDATPVVRECTFAGFIKCNPTIFHEGKKVKFAAAILQGPALTWWNAKVATIGLETVNQMPWTEMKDERILEGKKQKWERFQSGNNSGKRNDKENSRQTSQNNQKQGNARSMTTAPTDGKVSSGSLPVCKRCFTRHVGQCMIKCHKCGKVRHKTRYCKEKNVATGVNAHPILTCYGYGVTPRQWRKHRMR